MNDPSKKPSLSPQPTPSLVSLMETFSLDTEPLPVESHVESNAESKKHERPDETADESTKRSRHTFVF